MIIRASPSPVPLRFCALALTCAALAFVGGCQTAPGRITTVPKWQIFETSFTSAGRYANPPQEVELTVVFLSPDGVPTRRFGFWDGGATWRVRFAPAQVGRWTYTTSCSRRDDSGLHDRFGAFTVVAARGHNVFHRHGPVRVAPSRRYFEQDDRTPFFLVVDAEPNGALKSTPADWRDYLATRKTEGFNTVQWIATQWSGAPDGDRSGRHAYTGVERIELNPLFFQRLDEKVAAAARMGFLTAPILLWSEEPGADSSMSIAPGTGLPESQAILLARYMLARWAAYPCIWILGGGGGDRGVAADRWKRIGRAVFGNADHGPATLLPGAQRWVSNEFRHESWMDFIAYQTGDGDDESSLRWTWSGPQTTGWDLDPTRPILRLESNTTHGGPDGTGSGTRRQPDAGRRAVYWSLLTVPPAGVSRARSSRWNTGAASEPSADRFAPEPAGSRSAAPRTGWNRHMGFLRDLIESVHFWTLIPEPALMASQPGEVDPANFIASAISRSGDVAVIYTPTDQPVALKRDRMPKHPLARWFNPRTGETSDVAAALQPAQVVFTPPGKGDWVLVLRGDKN